MSSDSQIGRYVPAPLEDTASTIRDVVALAGDRNLTYLAAGIAFYAFVSIIPLILLAVAVASFAGGEALAGRVTGIFSQQLSSAGQDSVTQALTDTSDRGAASVVGFLGLAWSALVPVAGTPLCQRPRVAPADHRSRIRVPADLLRAPAGRRVDT